MSQEITPIPERTIVQKIFISPDEPRLRAGWRLLLQTLLLILISIPLNLVAYALKLHEITGNLGFLVSQILELIILGSSIYIARRWLDKRSFESLGLKVNRQAWVDILTGIGITFIQMGFIYAVMLGLGWLSFTGFAWQFDSLNVVITSVLAFFVIFIFVGWNEELLSRGYHLQTLASGINLFWGVMISSAVFGLLHLGNPNATWVSAAGIFFAGIYLAYGYIRTKQLWLSIGLHIGWNFFEGVVFGFPVSGLDIYPLTRIQVTGPELWTGGAFGPEAGLIVLPSLIVGAVLIYWYTRGRESKEQ
ncbi:MAG: CPBP family intramembrane metalloprotease [Anaerolineales bacterium]|nr:CPBP family intramembrane metalloprotease [Anaerolineales bacterium]